MARPPRFTIAPLLVLAACGSETTPEPALEEEIVTLTLWGADAPPPSPDGLVFAGTYSTSLPFENPAPALGTRHQTDPVAQDRLDAHAEATEGATHIRVHRGTPPTAGALYVLSRPIPRRPGHSRWRPPRTRPDPAVTTVTRPTWTSYN